jgi:hypothetical protein
MTALNDIISRLEALLERERGSFTEATRAIAEHPLKADLHLASYRRGRVDALQFFLMELRYGRECIGMERVG